MSAVRERVGRLLRSRRAPEFAALLALLLGLPSLCFGELLDDHLMRAQALRADGPPAWDHFSFARPGELAGLREAGSLGWWSSDGFQAQLMRPLSALTHAWDYRAWPDALWLMHLENVLIYALLTWLVARLIQRVHGPGLAAGVAGLVFAIDENHALSAFWLAGRNTLLTALFGVLAVHAHLAWRGSKASRRWPLALVGPACLALALACGEAGLCGFGYLVAWSWFCERGRWTRRLAPLLPHVAIIVGWRILYVTLGFGVTGSSIYVDIGARPLTFVARALVYPPSLASAQLSVPIADLLVIAPPTWIALTLIFAGLVWALRPLLHSNEARFWLAGMLFAAIPFAATIPTSRLLLILGVGSSALVGLAFAGWREGVFKGRARRALIGLILVSNLVLAPLAFVPFGFTSTMLERSHRVLAEQMPEDVEVGVILNIPTELSALYPKSVREAAGGRWPEHVYTLYAGTDPLEVERLDQTTLELRSSEGWAAKPIDRFARDWREGFAVGQRVELEHAVVELLEVSDDGRPLRVRVKLDRDLDQVAIYGFDPKLGRWRPAVGDVEQFTAVLGDG